MALLVRAEGTKANQKLLPLFMVSIERLTLDGCVIAEVSQCLFLLAHQIKLVHLEKNAFS